MRILSLLLFISVMAHAQQPGNFSVDNEKITWQMIFESDMSQDEIKSAISKNAVISSLADTFAGNSTPQKLNCEKKNQSIFMDGPMEFFAVIDFKDSKYRVTVTNIRFTPSVTMNFGGASTTEHPEPYETWMLKSSGELKSSKIAEKGLECIDQFLTETFTFSKSNSDW